VTEVRRVRGVWTGIAGSPYLSTWYFENEIGKSDQIVTALRKFLTTLRPCFYLGLSVNLEASHDILTAEDGKLLGSESSTPGAAITGTGSGELLPPQCQGVMKLSTAGIVNGRRVRGRFFVPAPTELSSDGTPSATFKDAINTAGSTLVVDTVSTGQWVVFSRPLEADQIPQGSDLEPREGSIHVVQTATAWNKFGIQRRRRD
jgi:hypothetical protein